MQSSKIIEIDGIFVGAAITLPDEAGWRFVSTDQRARQADGHTAPTLNDARTLARRAWFSSGVKVPDLGCAACVEFDS